MFNTAWAYLVLAGLCEIGWPLGFKLSEHPHFKVWGIAGAIFSMALSGWLLWMAQRTIPIGTAYAVWTGIGGAGTFFLECCFLAMPSAFCVLSAWP